MIFEPAQREAADLAEPEPNLQPIDEHRAYVQTAVANGSVLELLQVICDEIGRGFTISLGLG